MGRNDFLETVRLQASVSKCKVSDVNPGDAVILNEGEICVALNRCESNGFLFRNMSTGAGIIVKPDTLVKVVRKVDSL